MSSGGTAQRGLIGEVPFAVDVHLALIRAYERVLHLNTQQASRWGITAQQYNAMRILYFSEPGGKRLAEIGDSLLQRVPDVSRLVDRLEHAGFASRRPDPEDGRATRVLLTAEGRRLLEDMDADFLAAHERWYSGLTPTEQRRLESLLRKVADSNEARTDDVSPKQSGRKDGHDNHRNVRSRYSRPSSP
jgi:DNA-binding MarR family transcriptional regulator